MKLIIVVLSDEDAEPVLDRLIEAEFRVTRIASTGGFFRRGNSTLFIGTDDSRVEAALDVLRQRTSDVAEAGQHGAAVFVLDVERFEQL